MTGDTPRRVRADLRFMKLYVYTVPTVFRYRPDPACANRSDAALDVLGRVEEELAGEAQRYRRVGAAVVAVVLMPALLGGLLWSGLYVLPVRVPWFPFDRGMYGLPLFSLYEWLAFLLLAAFLAYSLSLTYTSHWRMRLLTADYHRLAETDDDGRSQIAGAASEQRFPRTRFVLANSPVFSAYRPLLARSLAEDV